MRLYHGMNHGHAEYAKRAPFQAWSYVAENILGANETWRGSRAPLGINSAEDAALMIINSVARQACVRATVSGRAPCTARGRL
jgi:hypothetical protein